jgi:hypothetical protein
MGFSTNYPCPSITHGKITRVEQKLKLSVLLAKEIYQFGKHNRSSVWVCTWTVPVTPFANLVMEYHIN